MQPHVEYSWERLPEYRLTQQYDHSLGRLLRSLPAPLRLRVTGTLSRAAPLISAGIAIAHTDVPSGEADIPLDDRNEAHAMALDCVALSRDGLSMVRRSGEGSAADFMVALDLLDRIEECLRRNPARVVP